MKKTFCSLISFVIIFIIVGCSENSATEVPALANTITALPSQTPTPTDTSTAIPEPVIFSPKHFSFPFAFEGQYSVGHPINYAPCYYWHPNDNLTLVTKDDWYNFFHAGDIFQLSKAPNKSEKTTILSPVSGIIETYQNTIEENAVGIVILTPYTYNGKPVRVSIFGHYWLSDGRKDGSEITQNERLATEQPNENNSENLDQVIIIEISIDKGSNYPLANDFNPTAFIPVYDYLADDLNPLVSAGNVIINDTDRSHCRMSGLIP